MSSVRMAAVSCIKSLVARQIGRQREGIAMHAPHNQADYDSFGDALSRCCAGDLAAHARSKECTDVASAQPVHYVV